MGPLSSLSFRAIRGIYYLAYDGAQDPWVPSVASMYRSDQPFEEYRSLTEAPAMEEWLGERKAKQLRDILIKVTTKKWSSTLEFDTDDVRRDKTGQIALRIADLGAKAGELAGRRLTTILEANGTGYDGAAFFATSHSHGGTVANLQTYNAVDPDVPTPAEMAAAISQVIASMSGYTNELGEPMNANRKQFAVVVPPKFAPATWSALRDQFIAAGQSNPLLASDWQIRPYVNARLTNTAAAAGRRFYVFVTDAAIRSLLWHEEDIGAEAFQVHGGEGTDIGFWRSGIAMGPKRIADGQLGRFELAARCELT